MNAKLRNGLSAIGLLVLLIVIGQLFNRATSPVEVNPPKKLMYKPMKVPKQLDFAGEKVPLEYIDVYESMDREMQVNAYWHSQALFILKRADRYFKVIEPILKAQGVPEDFKYLAVAESGLVDRAKSPAGAVGIWQFMRTTGREYGLQINSEVDERYHLEKSTKAACKYLKKNYEKFGSWTMVAATYNAGRSHILKQIARQKVNNYYDLLLNEETSRYVFRILALKQLLNNSEKFGFKVNDSDKYPFIPTTKVAVKTKVANFAQFALDHGINYKILKQFNPWLRQNYLTNKAGKTYHIAIPEKGYRIKK
ncbi:lytic transglycosylase domain-containing protein [Prolixibacteraceae bacterium JC049]|nr:lytic transglycosylase domain-containing protein [Prolixibacteraceae bacterium JC049]